LTTAEPTGRTRSIRRRVRARHRSCRSVRKTLAFNLGGHVNHSILWQNLSPTAGTSPMASSPPRSTTASARFRRSRPLTDGRGQRGGVGEGGSELSYPRAVPSSRSGSQRCPPVEYGCERAAVDCAVSLTRKVVSRRQVPSSRACLPYRDVRSGVGSKAPAASPCGGFEPATVAIRSNSAGRA
jgi:hypothetical protein